MGNQGEKITLGLIQHGQFLISRFQLLRSIGHHGFQASVLVRQIGLQPLDFQMGIDARQNFIQLKRFVDVIHPARLKCLELVRRGAVSTDKDNRNVTGDFPRLKLGANFKAIHLRHSHVQQNQIWRTPDGGG